MISGFVVTPLILRIFEDRERPNGLSANLLKFYRRRFFRLAPALGVTLLGSTIGIFLFGNLNDHLRFARQGIATLLLLGNAGAFKYSGNYFSPNPNPIIHTWSLSVEEQIYLILPLVIILFLRKSKNIGKNALASIFSIFLVSSFLFIYPEILNPLYLHLGIHDPVSVSFYSPLARIWQFCLGGLIFLIDQKRKEESKVLPSFVRLTQAGALLFIFAPALHVEIRMGSIIASTITAFVLTYKSLDVLPHFLSRILEWLGDRSYSIYLVHMPLLYIAKYSPLTFLDSNRKLSTLTAVVLSILLGNIIFHKVEENFRLKTSFNGSKKHGIPQTLSLFVLMPFILLLLTNAAVQQNYQIILGKTWSESSKDSHKVLLKGCVDQSFDPVKCLWPSSKRNGTVLVVGDSQAYADADGVIVAANSLGFNVIASSRRVVHFWMLILREQNQSVVGGGRN